MHSLVFESFRGFDYKYCHSRLPEKKRSFQRDLSQGEVSGSPSVLTHRALPCIKMAKIPPFASHTFALILFFLRAVFLRLPLLSSTPWNKWAYQIIRKTDNRRIENGEESPVGMAPLINKVKEGKTQVAMTFFTSQFFRFLFVIFLGIIFFGFFFF